jgi:ABC-type multidrug transport system ATPase subunit
MRDASCTASSPGTTSRSAVDDRRAPRNRRHRAGGERHRTAQALRPTTGLDLRSRKELWSTIRELVSEGTSVLLTTQYLEEADQLAHRVAVIDHGRIIAEGTPEELKARLGRTVIELGMDDEATAARSAALVSRILPKPAELEAATVRVTSDDGPRVLVDVLKSLDAADLVPARLSVREPSLDDVFLLLTGKHTDADGDAAAVSGGRS